MKKIILCMFIMVFISACNEYSPSKDDVVDKHGETTNIEAFIQFVENVKQGTKDEIRVVRYTTEGDAMLQDLKYDGENIISTTDTTRDQYGNGSVTTTTCKSIKVKKTEKRTDYILSGCENTNIDQTILVIMK